MMNGHGKSDRPVVPAKPPNKDGRRRRRGYGAPYTGTKAETPETAKGSPKAFRPWESEGVEEVEESRLAKGNTDRQNAPRTQSRNEGARSALDRVRQVAKRSRSERFTALLHHVTIDRLREAFLKLNRKAAPGVDDVTWEQYAEDLEIHLQDLHARLHRGAFRAKPSRRVIPEGGRSRATSRPCVAGRQDCPAGRRRGAERNLRDGLSRLLLWVSTWAQSTSSIGCADRWDSSEEGELGARRRHS